MDTANVKLTVVFGVNILLFIFTATDFNITIDLPAMYSFTFLLQ